MKHEVKVIATAIDLFFEGLSTRKIRRQLMKIFGIKVSHVTIWRWIIKFSQLAGELLLELTPELSGRWQADETMLPCRDGKGLLKWVWQIMDEETRWLVALHISENRDAKEAIALFKKGLEFAKAKPKVVVTDGLWAYGKAYRKILWSRYKARRPKYMKFAGLGSGMTNHIERLHGTLKDKTKPLRGFKKMWSMEAILTGWMVHYNLVRPHGALNGKTPGMVANVDIEPSWEFIIREATYRHYRPPS